MKSKFQSLVTFAQEIERIEKSKNDFLVPSKSSFMKDDNFLEIDGSAERYGINEFAHGQIADKLGIPRKYYEKMSDIPGLRSLNVNGWLQNRDERNLVRTIDNKVRAVLSDRFKPLDNYDIINNSIFPVLQPISSDLQVKALNISETKMYMQLILKNLQTEIKVGDTVQYGLTITNSEVGAGSLNVEGWIYRLSCSNGLISNSLFKKYHIGKRIEDDENYHIWQSDTLQKELEGYQLRLRDVLKNVLTMVNFEKEVNKIREAAEDKIQNITQTVENVTKRFGLSEKDGSSIIQNMVYEGNSNRWGLINGITRLAQEIENPDKSYSMEKLGGQIIELPKSEWQVLNAA